MKDDSSKHKANLSSDFYVRYCIVIFLSNPCLGCFLGMLLARLLPTALRMLAINSSLLSLTWYSFTPAAMPRAISSSPASDDSAITGNPAKRPSARICRVRCQPVQARHLDVGGHQVDFARVTIEDLPGSLAVFRRQHPAADRFHQALNLAAEEIRIVGHQHRRRTARRISERHRQPSTPLLPRCTEFGQFENIQQQNGAILEHGRPGDARLP